MWYFFNRPTEGEKLQKYFVTVETTIVQNILYKCDQNLIATEYTQTAWKFMIQYAELLIPR